MDKAPFENEETSSSELKKLESEHSVIVETQSIDVLSLPQKSLLSDLDIEEIKQSSLVDPTIDENWLLLSQDWQEQSFQKTDMSVLLKKIIKQTIRRTLWAKALLIIDIIATISIFILLSVGLYKGTWGTTTIVFLVVVGITSIAFVYYEIKIRSHLWQHNCDSPDKAIANAILGIESSIKYSKLIKLSCWLFLPVVNGHFYMVAEESEKSLFYSIFMFNLFNIAVWAISHWFYLRRNKELKKLRSL